MTAVAPQPNYGECQNCHCINTLVAAITTHVASLYCRACGYGFEINVGANSLPAGENAWFAQPQTNEHLLERPARRASPPRRA